MEAGGEKRGKGGRGGGGRRINRIGGGRSDGGDAEKAGRVESGGRWDVEIGVGEYRGGSRSVGGGSIRREIR